jgi:hypothetical protein
MTAAEAAGDLLSRLKVPRYSGSVVRDWFAAHWPSVGGAAPRVVTGREMFDALHDGEFDWYESGRASHETWNAAAARLTARAGATPNSGAGSSSSGVTETAAGIQTVPVTIVRRPVERPSPFLAAPSAGLYMKRSQDGEISGPVRLPEGCIVGRSVAAICRVDTDAPTWIERTPVQTARAWTAGDCEACVGQRVMTVSDENVTNADHWKEGETAEHIATCFTGWGIEWYVVVPTLEVSP